MQEKKHLAATWKTGAIILCQCLARLRRNCSPLSRASLLGDTPSLRGNGIAFLSHLALCTVITRNDGRNLWLSLATTRTRFTSQGYRVCCPGSPSIFEAWKHAQPRHYRHRY